MWDKVQKNVWIMWENGMHNVIKWYEQCEKRYK